MRDEYSVFCSEIYRITGINLALYKDQQMKRRLNTFMHKLRVESYDQLAKKIEKDQTALKMFHEFVTINVTDFFRDNEQFETLRKRILPQLVKSGSPFRAWSAGCSDGREAYSLLMMLEEMGVTDYQIHGTDLDERILEKARQGIYNEEAVHKVPAHLLAKYFTKLPDGNYQFAPEKARKVQFYKHDLLADEYRKGFDLIVCRNVVIYFTEEAKDFVFAKMAKSLKPDGILFVGGTESILAPKALGLTPVLPFFYKRDDSM